MKRFCNRWLLPVLCVLTAASLAMLLWHDAANRYVHPIPLDAGDICSIIASVPAGCQGWYDFSLSEADIAQFCQLWNGMHLIAIEPYYKPGLEHCLSEEGPSSSVDIVYADGTTALYVFTDLYLSRNQRTDCYIWGCDEGYNVWDYLQMLSESEVYAQ